ncbi:MAG: RNA polymerase sigma factor [Clostridia bacterium]|nr:RNA polymerase sigma factor [Clostridia bacterium]
MSAKGKDPSARMEEGRFEELYAAYARDVLRVSYFYLHDRDKAEDVTQDVFMKLLLTAPDLVPGKEKSWLMKVALNRCRDLWRSAWLKRVTLGIEKVERHRAPDRTDEFLEREELLDAIGRLSPDMRSVVLLHYYQGMGVSEIAELLKVPEGTVSSRLSRSRSRLEDLLKERE